MVWDFDGNTSVAYCYEEAQADEVADALNATPHLRENPRWIPIDDAGAAI